VANVRAVRGATVAGVLILTMLGGCSREKIDWKSAESADTVEAYDHFIGRHPDSELAAQARARVAQLNEDRDWKNATATDTADAYRRFLAQHESGKWAEEARIRVENFALDGTAMGPAGPTAEPESAVSMPAPVTTTPPAVVPPPAVAPKPGSQSASAAEKAVQTVPAAPTPVTDTPAQFGVQLGAFRTQEAALKDWKRLQTRFDADLHGLFARAVPIQHSAGQLFRLQAPVGEEARARAICASLIKQSQPCVVVLPPPR
jgi:cell division septation protein DedD